MEIRTQYEGLINSYIDAAQVLTAEEWEAAIRKEAEDLEQTISDEDIKGIIGVLEEEGLVATVKYDLVEMSVEIPYAQRSEILQGCTYPDEAPETKASFVSKADAYKELEKYETSIRKLSGGQGTYFLVTEYAIIEHHYDPEGEMLDFEEVWKYTEMKEVEG